MNTTEKIVFEKDNKQVIQCGEHFFARVIEGNESFESEDFNTLERAKLNLGILPTLLENNKMIAEFMGKKELITESEFLAMEHKAHNPTIIESLKYDKDWNWLIPVINIIQSVCEEPEEIDCLKYMLWNLDIKRTYIECVDFIKEYNQQKHTS